MIFNWVSVIRLRLFLKMLLSWALIILVVKVGLILLVLFGDKLITMMWHIAGQLILYIIFTINFRRMKLSFVLDILLIKVIIFLLLMKL